MTARIHSTVMYMRGKCFFVILLVIAALMLTACTQIVTDSADELRLYTWQGETVGGDSATLSFDDMQGTLLIRYPDTEMTVSGFCIVTDDKVIICDDQCGYDYTFAYKLYGDRLELSYDSSQISLKKIK